MTFIRFPVNSKHDFVINHQLDCPKQLIIGYNWSLFLSLVCKLKKEKMCSQKPFWNKKSDKVFLGLTVEYNDLINIYKIVHFEKGSCILENKINTLD